MKKPYRAWINQPSTLQDLHKYHGKMCIVVHEPGDDKVVTAYFTEGDIFSMRVFKSATAKCSGC